MQLISQIGGATIVWQFIVHNDWIIISNQGTN
jgi:hypothetical protein